MQNLIKLIWFELGYSCFFTTFALSMVATRLPRDDGPIGTITPTLPMVLALKGRCRVSQPHLRKSAISSSVIVSLIRKYV